MKVLFSGQIAKEVDFPEDVEDLVRLAPTEGRIIICDGASESFAARVWAHLLADELVQGSMSIQDHISKAVISYKSHFDFAAMSWSKQEAFKRGSFATILAITNSQTNSEIEVLAIGDSVVFLVDEMRLVDSFPYSRASEFQVRPQLVSSNPSGNAFVLEAPSLDVFRRRWNLGGLKAPQAMCMTDALGEWVLRNMEAEDPRWQQLCTITDFNEFQTLVIQERDSRSLRVDDVTLVRLGLTGTETDEIPEP